jgi:chromosome segregation ATPase
MALFSERASMLEVQNRALIKTAGERAQRISDLERELQQAGQEVERLKAGGEQASQVKQLKTEVERLTAEVERANTEVERAKTEVERLKLEREFYHKSALALEEHNGKLTQSATNYSLWGQSLARELDRIDPDGAPAREFRAWTASQASKLKNQQ